MAENSNLDEATAAGSWLERSAAEVKKFTPASGYNVVGVDRMEKPGEALYLVLHTEDPDEAERVATAHAKKSGNKTHVYKAKGAK